MGNLWSLQAREEPHSWDLSWTTSALVCLSQMSDDLKRDLGLKDKRSAYLTNIKVSAWFLQKHLRAIGDMDDDTSAEVIREMAEHLTIIFNLAPRRENGLLISTFELQQRLCTTLNLPKKHWERTLKNILRSSLDDFETNWVRLQLCMESLIDKHECRNRTLADEIAASKNLQSLEPPEEDTCQFISSTLDAALCNCNIRSQREVRLRLGTYRRFGRKAKPTSLCLLMSRTTERGAQWHELNISAGSRSTSTSPVVCICKHLRGHDTSHYELNLVLSRGVLTRPQGLPREVKFKSDSLKDQIDLKSLISIPDKIWDLDTKWTLSILLAYSLFYLQGRSRIENLLQPANIWFFHDGSEIPLRPFLGNNQPPAFDEPNEFHSDPHILSLGIMMLEVFLGESLESFLVKRDLPAENNMWYRALRVFEHRELFCLPPLFRQAIRACLSPATFEDAKMDDKAVLGLEVFRRIIYPLEAAAWEHFQTLDPRDPDEAAAMAFNLARGVNQSLLSHWSDVSRRQVPPPVRPIPGHLDLHEEDVHDHALPHIEMNTGGLGLLSDMRPANPDSRFDCLPLDAEASNKSVDEWCYWFRDFTRFRDTVFSRIPSGDGNTHRSRVTIIDTGIDASHPFIKSTRWTAYDDEDDICLFHDFAAVENATPVDSDGHGTFIAGLLLELAPDIQLSVARIGTTTDNIRNDESVPKRVAKAIDHAINFWKTEVISISLGLTHRSIELQKAIETAVSRGIIVLAAAGNHGNNRPMNYPAKHNGVFKILGAEKDGSMVGFSAVPDADASLYAFATVGQHIVSTWPPHLRQQAIKNGYRALCWNSKSSRPKSVCKHDGDGCDLRVILSGTSFATPIVAAHVALIFQFYNQGPSHGWPIHLAGGRVDRFKTPDAVRAMLAAMSRTVSTSNNGICNLLAPEWGRDGCMNFHAGKPECSGKSRQEFFAAQLTKALYDAGI